jgi:hypothetical protein
VAKYQDEDAFGENFPKIEEVFWIPSFFKFPLLGFKIRFI